ncbi:Germacradienol/geosmin synthase [Enhygromyxa salina]|uniref:Terpene synthase n=1 Tax=Enhygromyxa salina TaxID=215803 RepID=A0A2S9YGU0_9BACT|nr:germacradienol/geosmin synthase [Enhygromyxa salina]PRQ04309.1 Germacradienol/geosmin synthase [Enhygromyxa salina]
MPAYELPPLYMPYPARLNPNVEATRTHTKAWAHEMGMLGSRAGEASSFTWDEASYDTHDYALLCAYTHPDLPPAELDLISDWYVWLFFFDDHFLETFKRGRDMAGGKEYLARIRAFMPLELQPQSSLPTPTNPVERGMAELWARTAPQTSISWRRRYIADTRDTLETVLWELSNISHGRVANPLEYVAMRRLVGGSLWAADLLERAAGIELSDTVVATRPLRVLQDTFADTVSLHNDLMSYQREVEDEGEKSNGVLVLEKFLGVGPQAAAKLANDVLSSRIHQFENTVVAELPLLFEQYALPPNQRLDVRRYANGLMTWLAGDYEWHFLSARYDGHGGHGGSARARQDPPRAACMGPTELGTSAALGLGPGEAGVAVRPRPPRPPQLRASALEDGEAGAPLARPNFYMPFEARLSPHVDTARERTRAWAMRVGMFDVGVWTAAKFEADDLPRLAGSVSPDASVDALTLISNWCAWTYFVNDYYVEVYKRRRDLSGAKVFSNRLQSFLSDAALPPTNPAERGLVELWPRSAANLPLDLRHAFAARIRSYVEGPLWEILNTIQDRTPDPIDYYEMRRTTGGSELALSFMQLGGALALPPEAELSPTMTGLIQAFCDVMPLRNDILSYDKELRDEGEFVNGVVVLQRVFDCDADQAAALTNSLVTARLEQFEHVVASSLPAMFEELELDGAARATVRQYVGRLEDWMAGELEWASTSGRFAEGVQPAKLLRAPAGLRTSVARVQAAARQAPPSATEHVPPNTAPDAPKRDAAQEHALRASVRRGSDPATPER